MSASQREADLLFLRAIVADTKVGSAQVAMAAALDRLTLEPLVDAPPKVASPAPSPAPSSKVKAKAKPKPEGEAGS